jgi:hypothetical protein
MQKMIIAATVLLLAQIGLLLAFNMGAKDREAGAPNTLFVTFSPDEVQTLAITDGKGKGVILEKDKDGWIVPAHFSAPVNLNKVKTLLDKLAGMKQGFVLATSEEAAQRFKVDSESFEKHVVLRGTEKTLADFYVGTSPAFRQVHARRGESDEIVTIPLTDFEVESTTDKWLDTSLAMIKDEDLTGLTFDKFKLKKETGGWQLEGLKEGEQLNQEEVNALVTNARNLIVQDVLDPAKVSGLFDHPAFRFTTVRKGGKEVEYLFAGGDAGFYVLKLSDRDLYLKVHNLPVEALQKATREKLVAAAKAAENSTESVESVEAAEKK